VLTGRGLRTASLAAIALAVFITRIFGMAYQFPALAVPVWLSLRRVVRGPFEQRAFSIAMLVYGLVLWNGVLGNYVPGWTVFTGAGLQAGPFTIYLSGFVSTLFSVAGLVVMMRLLANDRSQRERLQREVEAARAIQQLLLQPASGSSEYRTEAVY